MKTSQIRFSANADSDMQYIVPSESANQPILASLTAYNAV